LLLLLLGLQHSPLSLVLLVGAGGCCENVGWRRRRRRLLLQGQSLGGLRRRRSVPRPGVHRGQGRFDVLDRRRRQGRRLRLRLDALLILVMMSILRAVIEDAIAVGALSVRSLVAAASTGASAPDAIGTTWWLMAVVVVAQPVTLPMTLAILLAHLLLAPGALRGDRLELAVVADVAVVQPFSLTLTVLFA